jgi:TonB family protein
MSGEKLLPRSEKQKPGPLEASLRVEDDKRLFGCTGAGSVFGMAFAAWALTTVPYIPKALVIWTDPPDVGRSDTVRILITPPEDYHGPRKKPKLAKNTPKPGQTGNQRPKAKSRKPAEKSGWMGQNLLTSRGDRLDVNAYDLIPKAMRLDMDKLDELPVLKRTPHSGISGRRGMQTSEFNYAHYEDGEGGDGGITDRPTGMGPGKIETQLKRVAGPRPDKSIEMTLDGNARSTASILAVIRSRSPGLRHIYNNFLKQNPGFSGKINLRFEIAPGGDVVSVEIASSTTHVRDFDIEILRQVKSWRFDPVKAIGNDNVTVPISFSE